MQRSILEKALLCVLNEQHEEATKYFHQFMLARARQIHESLRQGDESVLEESWNEELSEEYFTEDDLNGLEDEAEGDIDGAEDDLDDADADLDTVAADDAAADDLDTPDFGGDMDDDAEGDVDVSDEALEDIKAQLEKLTADFEAVLNGDDTIDDSELPGDDEDLAPSTAPEMDDMADDAAVDADVAASDAEMASGDAETADEDEHVFGESEEAGDDEELEESEDDFADIAESITSELEKISIEMKTDGKEIGAGKTATTNTTSNLPKAKADAKDAKPIVTKSSTHTGYERETAPTVKDMTKKPRNVRSKANDGRSNVSKTGDGAALLNKDFAGGK